MAVDHLHSMRNRGPLITEEDVLRLEQKLGQRLPEDYREFLLAFNGGKPSREQLIFDIGGDTTILNSFCKLNSDRGNLEKMYDLVSQEDDFSPELLVIGHDDGGSRVCLVIHGDKRGEVWFNDRLDPHEPKLFLKWYERKRDFKKLANSFTEFIKMLRPYDED